MNSTVTNHPRRRGVVVWVFTVLLALGGLLGPAVSAAAGVGPETRVRASDHPGPGLVGRVDLESSTTVGVSDPDLRQVVSATGVATNSAGLSDDVVRLSDSHLTGSGETVLGHYADDYVGLAQSRGASYFDIGDAYNGLTGPQQWAANQRVLDAAIANGDRITMATSRLNIRPGSPLAQEIEYLTGPAGRYRWVDDTTLVPGG